MSTRTVLAGLAAAALLVSGCSGSEEPSGPATPKGFELPSGVELTDPGTTLDLGKPATVVLELGDGAASAVSVTVDEIREGDIADFRFFSLDAASKKATPFYVDLTVRNDGPAGMGGAAVPLLAHTDANTVYPASELVGDFEPCPASSLPDSFLAGSTATICSVYLVPEGEALETMDLQPGAAADAVRWKR